MRAWVSVAWQPSKYEKLMCCCDVCFSFSIHRSTVGFHGSGKHKCLKWFIFYIYLYKYKYKYRTYTFMRLAEDIQP